MRTKKWIELIFILCVIAGFAFAEEPQQGMRGRGNQNDMPQMSPAQRDRSAMGRTEMYRQRMAAQAETHAAEIKELEGIKKIAEEEKATKTAEAIQKLIDKKNTEYQKRVEQFEQMQKQREAQMQKRMRQQQLQQQPEQKRINDDDKGENDEN